MLINFDQIVSSYGKPKGVIHIGAHELEERSSYEKHGLFNTIWIEANPRLTEKVKNRTKFNDAERLFNFAAVESTQSEVSLNVTNADQSSSLLQLGTHKTYYPNIHVTETVQVPAMRMDKFIEKFDIQMTNYDFVNIDIQGAELAALKGFGNYLNHINYICAEVNEEHLYEDCCLLVELNAFLEEKGFQQRELSMTIDKWGDALFVRTELR
jgi:FkbM family methyltransferase